MGQWKIAQPQAETNLITNPSFETGTTGWTAVSTNTIAQSATVASGGNYSMWIVQNATGDLVRYATTSATFPTTNTTYTFSCDVYFADGWDGGDLTVTLDSLTGASVTSETADGTTTGSWQRIEATITIVTDVTGNIELNISSSASTTDDIYIDRVMLVEGDYTSTYVDGSLGDGYLWTGTPHESTSTRAAWVQNAGKVLDFNDDLSCPIENTTGTGLMPVVNLQHALAQQPGTLLQDIKYSAREWALQLMINGTSQANYHSIRQALIKALSNDNKRIDKVLVGKTFIYEGAAVNKEISAVYRDGLHVNKQDGFAEQSFQLQLLSPDPFFYATAGNSVSLDFSDSATHDGGGRRHVNLGDGDAVWDNFQDPNATANDIGDDENYYYLGLSNGLYRLAKPGTSGSFAVASGTGDGSVETMLFEADGNILVGGSFTTMDSVTCRGVARWDVSAESWSAVGPPSSGGTVYDMTIDPDTGDLYVVGDFTNWDGDADADYVAKWDGTNWSAVNSGVNDIVYACVYYGGELYIAGDFENMGTDSVDYLAKFDGTNWVDFHGVQIGDGISDNVRILELDNNNGFYLGGSFADIANDTDKSNIARWNGSSFEALGTGINASVAHITVHENLIYVAGAFVDDVAGFYNGSVWTDLDANFNIGAVASDTIHVALNGELLITGSWNGTVYYAGTNTINYAGTGIAYPVITVERTGGTGATLRRITNETTGATLFFDYDLLDGEVLTIDLNPTKRKMTSSLYGEKWRILPNSDLTDFYLVPANSSGNGQNIITAFIEGSLAAPSANLFLSWVDVYVSYD